MRERVKKRASVIAGAIKSGLAMVIPILFIGSFTVLLNGFPSMAYQDILNSFMDGALRKIIQLIQYSTLGVLAIYITVALNLSYVKKTDYSSGPVFRFGSLLGCMSGFFILVGFFSGEPDLSLLSGQGVFSAMVAGLTGSILFQKFESFFNTKKMIFVDGANTEFNAALHIIMPLISVTSVFAVVNYLITVCFGVQSVQHLFMKAVDSIFISMHRSYSSGLLFITLISIMWCFGIHGNNVLDQVAVDMFTEIIPGEIVSKSFIDSFVNMGGTGCTVGLLVAMLVFGKRSSTRKLSGMAFLPGMFNIGELLVFGFPVIYNPIMVVPFILSPILCFTNAFVLTKAGFMPQVTNEVVWTVPALMSGYLATGSVRGILVQIINILISTACYAPFVIMYEKKSLDDYSDSMDELVDIFKKSRETSEKTVLTECKQSAGRLAKHLAIDLEFSLSSALKDHSGMRSENPLRMDYELLNDDEGKCTGARSVLNWKHKSYGDIYPPMILQIAEESGDLFELEKYIIESAVRDSAAYRERYGEGFVMNVCVSDKTLGDKSFAYFMQKVADQYMLRAGNICLEVTGCDGHMTSEEISDLMDGIRIFGYSFKS